MSSPAPERRDHRVEHIAATKAKLTDQDSLAFFAAFLAGDVGPVLSEIIAKRVHEATIELLEQAGREYDARLDDIRDEFARQRRSGDRQLESQIQRADRSAMAIARVRELADIWEADCPGEDGTHLWCKGGRLRSAIAGVQS